MVANIANYGNLIPQPPNPGGRQLARWAPDT